MDWFITDHLGSTKLLIDQNGQHRFTGDDDPFGINLRSFGDKDTHRFTGQVLDEEQGVYYYGARYYLPEIGRFLSGDPKAQYFNLYCYAGNNPVMLIDPTGMEDDGYGSTYRTDEGKQLQAAGTIKPLNIVILQPNTTGAADIAAKAANALRAVSVAEGMKSPNITVVKDMDFVAKSSGVNAAANSTILHINELMSSGKISKDTNLIVLAANHEDNEALQGSKSALGFRAAVKGIINGIDPGGPFMGLIVASPTVREGTTEQIVIHEFWHGLGYYTEARHNNGEGMSFGESVWSMLPGRRGNSLHNDVMKGWMSNLPNSPNRSNQVVNNK